MEEGLARLLFFAKPSQGSETYSSSYPHAPRCVSIGTRPEQCPRKGPEMSTEAWVYWKRQCMVAWPGPCTIGASASWDSCGASLILTHR